MKKYLMILTIGALALPVFAQNTNELKKTKGERYGKRTKGERGERKRKEHRDLSLEKQAEMQEYRLQLMEKTLKDIGISEEQKAQIFDIQQKMREQMKTAYREVEENRKKLSELEKAGASEVEIYAAIDEVSDAQADQMKILARSRIQMERILGKEKFQLFMESARNKWHEHGRRGGTGLPPRPNSGSGKPPKPPAGSEGQTP